MILNYLNISYLDMGIMSNHLSKNYLKVLNEKYLFNRDKLLSGGGRIVLKYILSKLGIDNYTISIDDSGKPYIYNIPNLHFNISHSDQFVLVGVSNENIGVDIEKIQDLDYNGISKHFFHLLEHEKIVNSKNPIKTFFKIWTLKESYAKMKGTGITDLKSFLVDIEKNRIEDMKEDKTEDVKLKSWELNSEYYISTCSKKKNIIKKPQEIQYSEINSSWKP
ncbi:MAG: 4'-phosphopantetheinyl transferase superfamily protein [Methanobrevibacter sp.]|jgi:4'-phosphopantetheinyl transferase|nr:4'-phosphopantetheinyl transferase superfamily protein [Candidatus Methanovirga basalitermitum]